MSSSHTVIDLDEIIDAPVMALPSLADLDPTDFGDPDEDFAEPDDFGEPDAGDTDAEIEHLEELLAAQRARGAIRECAEICEQLARLVSDHERRRLFVEEAIAAYVATGNPVRADALASWVRSVR